MAKINLQFISNCLGRIQTYIGSLCFGKQHNLKAYLRTVVVEPPGHNKPLEGPIMDSDYVKMFL